MEKLQTVLDLQLKQHRALGYGLVSLLTAGGERLFSTAVFQCPCSAAWNLPYGLVFLLVPALALFLLGLVLNARTWRLLTGCCARSSRSRARGCGAGLRAGRWAASSPGRALGVTWKAAWGVREVTNPFFLLREEDLKLLLVRHNQLIAVLLCFPKVLGWILIAVVIIFLLIFTSVSRCLSPVSFLQLKFWKIYLEQEQQILKAQATEHAMELAKENVKCFFECLHPEECNTPSIKDWQQISSLYTFNPKEQYYSMLHKYVNRKEKTHSIISKEGDAVIPVLGFVDTPGINTTAEL
nr:calcium homeostasis modulator protein 6 [Vulpes vulpes]